jgi:hypothetical protein
MARRPYRLIRHLAVVAITSTLWTCTSGAESLPVQLRGSWRITRILKTTNTGCWSFERAQRLMGSTLDYGDKKMRWQGGDVPLLGITTRTVTDDDFRRDDAGNPKPLTLAELDIRGPLVTEVDFQHEDADITGASTEVPGDSVLLAASNRIVGSACGVYFEAMRAGAAHKPATSTRH